MMPMTLEERLRPRLSLVHTSRLRVLGLLIGLFAIGTVLTPAEAATQKRRPSVSSKASRTIHPKKRSTPADPTLRLSRTRRARLSRAKAARNRAQWLEMQQPRYKLDDEGTIVPDIRAAAAIIYNPDNGQILWEENSQNKRSIASITKVMTSTVFLEDLPDLTRVVTIERSDVSGARPHLSARQRPGDARRPAAPHAHRIRQRGSAGTGAVSPGRHRGLRAADEREGTRTRSRQHHLRRLPPGWIRPTCRRRTTWPA